MMSIQTRVRYVGATDRGLRREINQDAIYMYAGEKLALFCVADGVGGASHGEVASNEVAQALRIWCENIHPESEGSGLTDIVDMISERLQRVNNKLHSIAGSKICATTVAVLVIFDGRYAVISAGDSRVYCMEGESFRLSTVDDVWENQEEIRSGYHANDIINHKNRGKLVNAVGMREFFSPRIITDEIVPEMGFLLCSDGVYKYCSESVMRECLRCANESEQMKKAIRKMASEIEKKGAPDDASAILVKVI